MFLNFKRKNAVIKILRIILSIMFICIEKPKPAYYLAISIPVLIIANV